jgi:hypothetical protein
VDFGGKLGRFGRGLLMFWWGRVLEGGVLRVEIRRDYGDMEMVKICKILKPRIFGQYVNKLPYTVVVNFG